MKIFKITDRKVLRFKYREDINGLRALSVVSVILYHLDINLFGKKLFISGYLGVDVFFIISGFLISNIIISELTNNTFMFKSFYERRIRRVFPTLFITILISFFSSFMILTPKPMNEFLKSALAALLFVSNIFFSKLDFYNAEPTQVMPLLHTWSLGIEEQFYLLFPILCFTLYKYFKSYFLEIISLIAVISIFFNLGAGNVKFYLLQFRMWELLIGVILSTLFINFKLNLKYIKSIGFLILIYTLNSFDETSILQIEPKILIAFAVSLILISDNKNTYFDKLCNLKIIKNLGLISYSLYLFHQPLFAFAKIYIQKNTLEFTNINQNDYFLFQSFKSITPVLIAILFLISNLNYFFIEKKFINKTFNLKVLRNFFLY